MIAGSVGGSQVARQLRNLMQTGAREGMLALEKTPTRLVEQGVISHETAVAKANSPQGAGARAYRVPVSCATSLWNARTRAGGFRSSNVSV